MFAISGKTISSGRYCICRYEKYDKPMDKRRETKGDDPFTEEYEVMDAQIADLNKVNCIKLLHVDSIMIGQDYDGG